MPEFENANDRSVVAQPVSPFEHSPGPSPGVESWHKPVFIAFLLSFALDVAWFWLQPGSRPIAETGLGWIRSISLVLAVCTSLLALARRLPLQNVLVASLLIGLLSSLVLLLGAATGVPFGPVVYLESAGAKLSNRLPWTLPLLWIVVLINGRSVARLIMRPWRKTGHYGFWVIGLTALLAVAFDLVLEPFAARVGYYWLWRTGPTTLAWYTAPWVNFLGWFITAAGILVFTVPWLINKRPVKRPTDYHPLIMWTLLNAWLALGNGSQGLWLAVSVGVISTGATLWFAVRGAQWGRPA